MHQFWLSNVDGLVSSPMYALFMHPIEKVREALELSEQGFDSLEISQKLGINARTIRDWRLQGEDTLASPFRKRAAVRAESGEFYCQDMMACPRLAHTQCPEYAYLLGQYLGDGCVSRHRRTYALRIATTDIYPVIRQECIAAISKVMPENKVGVNTSPQGCSEVTCYSNHWPCLLPHGDGGVKHLRKIILTDWQHQLAIDKYPQMFLRGLIHSDGCRHINRVKAKETDKSYEYVRYSFSNRSMDIQGLFKEACEKLKIEAKNNNTYSVSISRRESVAKMDAFIGPKH